MGIRRSAGLLGALCVLATVGCQGSCGSGSSPNARAHALEPLPALPPVHIVAQPGTEGAQDLTIVVARPQDDVEGEVRPTVTFNKPVQSLATLSPTMAPVGRIEPSLAGEWKWLGSASAEFVPSGQVPFATAFTVTIPKGLKALDGAELKEDYVFKFSTPRVKLQEVFPPSGFNWLKPDTSFTLTFNQAVRADQLERTAVLKVEGESSPIPLRVVSHRTVVEEERAEYERAKKEGKHVSPPDLGDALRGQNRQVRFDMKPERPLPLGRAVTLSLPPGLLGDEGPLGTTEEGKAEFRTFGPLKLLQVYSCIPGTESCPDGPITFVTSNPIEVKTLRESLKITPPVKLDWDHVDSWSGNPKEGNLRSGQDGRELYLSLSGDFQPGTRYRVELSRGVKDAYGQGAQEPLDTHVQMDDRPAGLSGMTPVAVVRASQGTALPLTSVNLKGVDLQIWGLSLAEAAKALSIGAYSDEPRVARAPDENRRITLGDPVWRNKEQPVPVDLSGVFKGAANGIALVKAKVKEDTAQTLVQVTDLGVHAQIGGNKSVVWVARISSGQAVAGADVSVLDDKGSVKASGKTDEQGLVDLPGYESWLKGSEQSEFVMIAATLGSEVGISATGWDDGLEPYAFSLERGSTVGTPSASLLFTERGIYRPGEEVFFKGVFRLDQDGKLKTPRADQPFQVELTGPKGESLGKLTVSSTRYGTVAGSFKLPAEMGLGDCGLRAKSKSGPLTASASFKVAEYRPPQFKVDVQPAKPVVISGDDVKGKAFGRYLFGGAMADAKVKWSLTRERDTFTAEAFPTFSFAQEPQLGEDGETTQSYSTESVAGGTAQLDAQGQAELPGGLAEAPGNQPWRYTLEAEVQDVNRQTVAGRATVRVHPALVYVGLRGTSGFGQVGQESAIEGMVVDTGGKRVVGHSFQVEVVERTWKSIQTRDAQGDLTTQSEPVDKPVAKCPLQSAESAVACKFIPTEPGYYLATATVMDDAKRTHQASVSTYVLGPGFIAWGREDSNRIELLPEKPHYSVGEKARVLIKSSFEEAEALVTVERDGILTRQRLHLKGAVTSVEVPITEGMVPTVYVSALLIHQGKPQGNPQAKDDVTEPAMRFGLAKIGVDPTQKRLAVQVSTARPSYRPAEDVAVKLHVQDSGGTGVRAEVTVFAVDEGVLRLTDYQLPDPLAALFPERGLRVWLAEPLVHLVGQRGQAEKSETLGGDGGGASNGVTFRSNFRTTAVFAPTVETDAQGNAETHFKLPDNLTTFRIMAVAVSPEDRFGGGQASIEVNKPLLALPALPRFARVGDHFEAGVVVHRKGGAAGEVTVKASAEGGIVLDGSPERRTIVTDSTPQEIRFPFTATQVGMATLRFSVKGGADSDGVEQKIPVEVPAVPEVVAVTGDTTRSRTEGITPPKNVYPNIGGLEVTMASTSLGTLKDGFGQLVQYPYGCLEQQASRLVPFVALREIAGQFGMEWPGPNAKDLEKAKRTDAFLRLFLIDPLDVSAVKDPDEVVRKTVASIQQLQLEDGSFRYWSSSECSDSWDSAYATLSLTRAKQVGFEVKPEVLASAQAFVAKVAGGSCGPCERLCPLETQVFASYVLARAGRPKASTYGNFFAHRQELPLFTQALLADALFVGGGDRKQANQLLKEILNHAKESPRGVHFEETHSSSYVTLFHSDTRTTGAILQLLTDLDPNHPYVAKMAQYLTQVRRGNGEWRTTQEAAFSLMALTEVLRTKEKSTPSFKASLVLGGKPLVNATFQGRSLETQAQLLPMEALQKKLGPTTSVQPLVFQKDGEGVFYYSATLTYAPREMPKQPLEQGLFVQRWFEPYEGGGQSHKFYAGDLVRVRLRVGTNQERHWTAFEVPLPAGLEAVDTTLATTAKTTRTEEGDEAEPDEAADGDPGSGPDDDASPWTHAFWSPFNNVETRDSRVIFFADDLPPGIHLASFVARATTPGNFVLKPAHGELMYEPEVYGRTEGGLFEIVVGPQVAGR